jgi:tetratricopeptide (TPR) repeat protein
VAFAWLALILPLAWAQEPAPTLDAGYRQAAQHFQRGEYSRALEILVPLEKAHPGSFEVQHLLAVTLDVGGNPEAANVHFRKAVALNPKSAVVHANLGTSLVRVGKMDAAVTEFRLALGLEPDNATANFNLGTLLMQQRKLRDALPLLERAYAVQPRLYENGYHLALCHFLLGDHDSAGKVLASLMPVPKERAEFYLILALNQGALGNSGAARKALDEVLPLLSGKPEAHEQLALLLFSRQMYHEALPMLEEAVRRFPDSSMALLNLARAELHTGQLPQAQEHAKRALSLRETADAHSLLGDILEASQQSLAAVEHYQKAVQLDPSERNLISLGYEFMSHWNWKEAEAVFASALVRYRDSWRMRIGLGASWLGQEKFEEATRYFLEAIDMVPGEPFGYRLLAQSFSGAGDSFEKAVARFRTYYRAHPGDPHALYYHALAGHRLSERQDSTSNSDELIALLQAAVKREPDFPEAHLLMGDVFSRQRKWPEAVAAYESAVKQDPEHIGARYKLARSLQGTGQTVRAAAELKLYETLKEKQNQAAADWLARSARFIVD